MKNCRFRTKIEAGEIEQTIRKVSEGCGIHKNDAAVYSLLAAEELYAGAGSAEQKLAWLAAAGTALNAMDRLKPENEVQAVKMKDMAGMYDPQKVDSGLIQAMNKILGKRG